MRFKHFSEIKMGNCFVLADSVKEAVSRGTGLDLLIKIATDEAVDRYIGSILKIDPTCEIVSVSF